MLYHLIRPLLFQLEAERAHRLSTGAARLVQATSLGAVASLYGYEDETLRQSVWGVEVANPVGLAAGFDKNARLVPFWEALGFGFAEVGSVSARPAEGNPPPRAFRLPDARALINRMGLGSDGAEQVARTLKDRESSFPLGINLAKTSDPQITGAAAVEDFRTSFRQLAPRAGYVALNVSCPNTPDGRTFEEPKALDDLLAAVVAERSQMQIEVPVLIKLSPPADARIVYDSALEEIVAVARQHGVAGFVAANTANDRSGLATPAERLEEIGPGGLSGAPLAERSTVLVRYLYRLTDGQLPIIGVGGIDSAEAAYRKIRAGASLVELYTALVYEGPRLVKRIKEGLTRFLERDGFSSITEAIGADA